MLTEINHFDFPLSVGKMNYKSIYSQIYAQNHFAQLIKQLDKGKPEKSTDRLYQYILL